MTEATNEQNEYTSYVYDALGRRVSETQNRQPASHTTVKTYLPDLTSDIVMIAIGIWGVAQGINAIFSGIGVGAGGAAACAVAAPRNFWN